MNRKPLMAGNWKMHLNHLEAVALVQKVAFLLKDEDYAACDAVFCRRSPTCGVQTLVDGDKLKIQYGAQDVSEHARALPTPARSLLTCCQTRLHVCDRRSQRAPDVPPRGRRGG